MTNNGFYELLGILLDRERMAYESEDEWFDDEERDEWDDEEEDW